MANRKEKEKKCPKEDTENHLLVSAWLCSIEGDVTSVLRLITNSNGRGNLEEKCL